ncbi:asparagine synthase (glutamine-hydrolyzing) [Methanothermococcus okinawensis]|uniref:Putative asparagine synthetase [glutamine-hydrolyzing] n=1 Tax=Methanothermococcus okinawensis (strain DSM 14208 / JCM 11175 / IH1) TaxID=647113 RepID=F8AN05_METOI|nr:asparagine synthase (glutamine-hydrolyzing) [Methanothermococcus okinawensis]AEH06131.1 asparagine synthase (glutamine-hydrolyzing) [Methanothermococcus okinawensis IH1]
MCSINGIIVKDDDDEGPSSSCKKEILRHLINEMKILKHRGPDSSGLMFDDEVIYFNDFNNLNIPFDKSNRLGMGHNRLAIVGNASQPISNEDESIWTICNGEIYNYYELMEDLQNKHDFNTDTDSEIIIHSYEEGILDELDGDYAYCLYDKNENIILLRRDIFGVKPLFYIDRPNYFAFASEKKALWYLLMEIDIMSFEEAYHYPISRLNPNSQLIYDLDENEYEIEENIQKIRTDYFENNYKNIDYESCKKELEDALWDSISKRTRGIDKVGIIYSGGVDSTLVAKLASEYCDVVLYSVGTEESEDIKYAEKAAKDMGLKFRKKIISPEEYEKYLFNVAYAIDELNLMKLAVGIPIYAASEMAKQDGIKVVLSGQGADELFGGYNRYLKALNEMGKEKLKKLLYNDVMNIYKVNLERDDHCTMANGVELRVPFLDRDVVEVGLSLPIEYKLNDTERKIILRDIASNYIPDYIAYRPKKAAQYGSGSEKMIYATARKYGYSKKKINEFFKNVLMEKMEKHHI